MNNATVDSVNNASKVPLVSVGIPTYNRPEGLHRTLEYIIGQTYKNLEIIVSDNCSPDPDVERIGREYAARDTRIKYIRQSENIGAGNNFQFVLEKATGEYFMWAADDDVFSLDLIENCLFEFSLNNSLICVSTIVDRFDSIETQNILFRYDFYSNVGQNSYQRVKDISTISLSGKKRIATMICGLFRHDMIKNIKVESKFGGDFLFLIAVSAKGEFTTVPKKLIKKYGCRKSTDDFKRMANCQFTGNPYWYFVKEIIHTVESLDQLSNTQKFKIKIYLLFIFCKYRVVKPKLDSVLCGINKIKQILLKRKNT